MHTDPVPPASRPVLWLGSTRYTRPLAATEAKKWQAIQQHLGRPVHVLGFSTSLRPRAWRMGDLRLWLLPLPPIALVRHVGLLALVPWLVWWQMARYGVRTLICQSPYEGGMAAWALRVARLVGLRAALIIEAHDDFSRKLFVLRDVGRLRGLYAAAMRRLARYGLRRAHALRPVSVAGAQQMAALAPAVPQVRFIGWSDLDAFEQAQRRVPLAQARDIVCVAVISPVKNQALLLEALVDLPSDVRLLLIGAEVAPDYAAALRQQSARLGLAGRVLWLGKLPPAEVAQHVADARLLALPSNTEGLPRVLIEAMTCGTPVVATAVDGVPELVTHEQTGLLIPPQDITALHGALARLLHDDDLAQRLSEQGRAHARQHYSVTAYLEGYRALIATAEA